MPDFTQLTAAEVADFVETHGAEMDAPDVTSRDVLEALQAARAVLEVRPYGFALIQLQPTSTGSNIPFLWLLYVAPEHRGRGIGSKFVRELLRGYSSEYHMALYCYGAQRRRFFGRLGFVIESREGELRRMTTNRA